MKALLAGAAMITVACGTNPGYGGAFELVWIEAPTFCQGEVRSYSDVAYIRPSRETVIDNRCAKNGDSLGSDPAIWLAVPGYEGWQPPPDREKELSFEQRFKRGSTIPSDNDEGLARLLDVAKAHPDRPIQIVGDVAKGEPGDIARRRALAVRNWLSKNGVPAERMIIRPSGNQGALADPVITIIVRG